MVRVAASLKGKKHAMQAIFFSYGNILIFWSTPAHSRKKGTNKQTNKQTINFVFTCKSLRKCEKYSLPFVATVVDAVLLLLSFFFMCFLIYARTWKLHYYRILCCCCRHRCSSHFGVFWNGWILFLFPVPSNLNL